MIVIWTQLEESGDLLIYLKTFYDLLLNFKDKILLIMAFQENIKIASAINFK